MERSKTILWYEDLECHRQPSLYYLSSEDDPAGPHLICDWNGAPTDLGELEIDLMSKLIDAKTEEELENETRMLQINDPNALDDCDSQTQETIKPRSISSHTTLTENDGTQLNFLTVPPFVDNLIKRIVKNQGLKYPPIPEAVGPEQPIAQKNQTDITTVPTLKNKTKSSSEYKSGASPPKKPRTKSQKNDVNKGYETTEKGSKTRCKTIIQEKKPNGNTYYEPKAKSKLYNSVKDHSTSSVTTKHHAIDQRSKSHVDDNKVIVIDESD